MGPKGRFARWRPLAAALLSIAERREIRRLLQIPVAAWPATLRDATEDKQNPRPNLVRAGAAG